MGPHRIRGHDMKKHNAKDLRLARHRFGFEIRDGSHYSPLELDLREFGHICPNGSYPAVNRGMEHRLDADRVVAGGWSNALRDAAGVTVLADDDRPWVPRRLTRKQHARLVNILERI